MRKRATNTKQLQKEIEALKAKLQEQIELKNQAREDSKFWRESYNQLAGMAA